METIDTTKQIFKSTSNGKYVKIRMTCPNCGRAKWSKKIASNEVCDGTDIKCKCGITGYNWGYKPMRVGDKYVYINSSASVSETDMPKFIIRNEEKFRVSNGNKINRK